MAYHNTSKAKGFDIICDVHGHADALILLLNTLGYDSKQGYWAHPRRKAIFVGDLIDRGPKQQETCRIVREMVEAGSADICIGNHELNAVAYSTRTDSGEYLRPHSRKNQHQHASFVKEFPLGSVAHEEIIAWFQSLPLWLELQQEERGTARVIHACWDQETIKKVSPYLQSSEVGLTLGRDFSHDLFRPGHEAFTAVELLLKGPEVKMPEGSFFVDKSGIKRTQCRVAWWTEGDTWADVGIFGSRDIHGLNLDDPITEEQVILYQDSPPVFFGHYWRSRHTCLPTNKVACTDWSIAKEGQLAAYRWDGEQELSINKFVAVSESASHE